MSATVNYSRGRLSVFSFLRTVNEGINKVDVFSFYTIIIATATTTLRYAPARNQRLLAVQAQHGNFAE